MLKQAVAKDLKPGDDVIVASKMFGFLARGKFVKVNKDSDRILWVKITSFDLTGLDVKALTNNTPEFVANRTKSTYTISVEYQFGVLETFVEVKEGS